MSGKPIRRRSKQETPSRGRADLRRLRGMTEEEIAGTSPPELADLPDDFSVTAEFSRRLGPEGSGIAAHQAPSAIRAPHCFPQIETEYRP